MNQRPTSTVVSNNSAPGRSIPFEISILPVLLLFVGLAVNFYRLGPDALSGPSQITLIFAAACASLFGYAQGTPWESIYSAIVSSVSKAIPVILIILIVLRTAAGDTIENNRGRWDGDISPNFVEYVWRLSSCSIRCGSTDLYPVLLFQHSLPYSCDNFRFSRHWISDTTWRLKGLMGRHRLQYCRAIWEVSNKTAPPEKPPFLSVGQLGCG
jgi:hypothetical protein